MTNMIPVAYGYAGVSKTDDATRNLETQIYILQEFGIREEHIFADEMTGSSMSRPAWSELMCRVQPNDTVVVAWLDRFSRNFDEGVRIQAELTKKNVGIVAIRENINTAHDSAAAKLFRRMMLAQGAYQVKSTSERIQAGLNLARADGRRPGRPSALTPDQMQECRRMSADTPSFRRVARIMKVSQSTVKRALELKQPPWAKRGRCRV